MGKSFRFSIVHLSMLHIARMGYIHKTVMRKEKNITRCETCRIRWVFIAIICFWAKLDSNFAHWGHLSRF